MDFYKRKLTKEYLKIQYIQNKKSSRSIAKEFNCDHNTILNYLKKYNIKRRLRRDLFNSEYFKYINSEDKAYFLGFLFADGSIVGNSLKWKSIDKEILIKFKIFLESKNKINYIKEYNEYSLQIASPILRIDLEKLNFIPNKTFRLKMPKIKNKLLFHFIRGYFDGDGCIYSQSQKGNFYYPRLEFYSGCLSFLKEINKIFYNDGLIREKIRSNCFTLCFNGKIALNIMNLLYKDADIYLKRKKKKYLNILTKVSKKMSKEI